MKKSSEIISKPRNPYGTGILVLAVALFIGVVLIFQSGVGSVAEPAIGMLLPGICLVTLGGIFLLGAVISGRGFEKRFGRDSLLGYWEISGDEWQGHLEREKRKLRKLGLIGGLVFPGIVAGVMVYLAHSDGELDGMMPIALTVGAGIAVVVLLVVLFQWFALNGNQGCVWLARRGIVINRVVFFIDRNGMETLSRELEHEGGKHRLLIRYRVQVRHTTVDKELVVPVPEEQLELVRETIEGWNRGL